MKFRLNVCFWVNFRLSCVGLEKLKGTQQIRSSQEMSVNAEKLSPASFSTYCTSWQEHFSFFSWVSEPKITAAPMCSLWYENNQFGNNEIKIKGKFEQKQMYCDRLPSSGNFKAGVGAAWKSITPSPLKERKQILIFFLLCWQHEEKLETKTTWEASILSLLSFGGVASDWHNQAAEQPPVLTDWDAKVHHFVSRWL